MWKEPTNDGTEVESTCGRFIIFKLSNGGAQLVDRGTDTLPRRCLNFNSVKGAKISASMRLAGRRERSARYPKLSELTETQKQHCAWRLDRYSAAGLVWINRALRGVFGDLSVDDLFTRAGMKPRQAKIHATKTKNFNITLNQ